LERTIELDWISLEKLIGPNTLLGAASLATVMGILAWVACMITTRLVKRAEWVMGRLKRRIDETIVLYILRIKNLIIILAAALFYASLVPGLRALVGTMMAGAGITAIVVGFAAKSTIANLISGISLAIYRPIRIGDRVDIDGEYSTVEDITLRHTIVRTWEHKRLIIPNEKLDSMIITNYSLIDPRIICRVEMGVSYDTDIDLARRLILEEADRCPYRLKNADEPWVRIISHGDFSIGIRFYMWVPDMDAAWQAKFWILEHVKKRFDREGVEIPFPYRTLVYKKDLPPPRQEEPVD
jgi:small conductance mechanosensitive channel